MNRALEWWKPALCGVSMLLYLGAALPAEDSVMFTKDQVGNWIKLYFEPCPVSSGWLKLMKAVFFYQGKEYASCWMVQHANVIILDEDGSITSVPAAAFGKEEKI